MIASLGAVKDMMTDRQLLTTLCTLEKGTRILKCQFRETDKFQNFNLFRANIYQRLTMETAPTDIQAIKNILFSSFSTFELIETVTISKNVKLKNIDFYLEKMD